LGEIKYELTERIKKNKIFSFSLFVAKNIKDGEAFSEENVRSIRPGYGLPPKYLKYILGKQVKINIKKGMPLKWEIIN